MALPLEEKGDLRKKFAKVRVLLADRDRRTATLVASVLNSFGFKRVDVAVSGEEALKLLETARFDLIVTEWNMSPTNGLELVKAIRQAKDDQRIRRDVPIIMLTAKAELDDVRSARDAGITEFIVKPFSARTISDRLIQVVDNPRSFIDAEGFKGPDRRRKMGPPKTGERRGIRKPKQLPPNQELAQTIGPQRATDILTEKVVSQAQVELMKSETNFLEWAKDDIALLEKAYKEHELYRTSIKAHTALLEAAYSIKAQAGIFGYDLGTEVARMLVNYLNANGTLDENQLMVVRKHIDAIVVIFSQKIKETGRAIGEELIGSLKKLTEKYS